MTHRELTERINAIATDVEQRMQAAESENRALTSEELDQIDALLAEQKNHQRQLDTIAATRHMRQPKSTEPVQTQTQSIPKDQIRLIKEFRLMRAVSVLAAGKPLDGVEAEVSQEGSNEFRQQSGLTAEGNLQIPRFLTAGGMKEFRDITAGTPSTGGYTIATDLLGLIPFLDTRLAVMQMGATMLTGLRGNVDFPRNITVASATWEGENDDNAETTPTFDKLSMSPNRLGAFTDISKQNLAQTSIDMENFIRNQLNRAVSRALDYALINGDGVTELITGILNTAGINTVSLGTDGGSPTYGKIIDMETELATDDADFGTLGYLTTPGVRGFLKQTEVANGTGRFVWQDGGMPAMNQPRVDLLNGYRALVSTQVPNDLTKGSGTNLHAVIYGNWSELVIGQWAGIDLVVDPYSNSKKALVTLVINSWWDAIVRHAASFCAIKDADITGAV